MIKLFARCSVKTIKKKIMDKEGKIRSKVGDGNPFRVPEGYFDSFASQLMDKLPERKSSMVEQPRSLLSVKRPLMYAAACLFAAVFSVAVYFVKIAPAGEHVQQHTTAMHIQKSAIDAYMDEVADYAMVDNTDIYACLASE
jgi:hypothetical protein